MGSFCEFNCCCVGLANDDDDDDGQVAAKNVKNTKSRFAMTCNARVRGGKTKTRTYPVNRLRSKTVYEIHERRVSTAANDTFECWRRVRCGWPKNRERVRRPSVGALPSTGYQYVFVTAVLSPRRVISSRVTRNVITPTGLYAISVSSSSSDRAQAQSIKESHDSRFSRIHLTALLVTGIRPDRHRVNVSRLTCIIYVLQLSSRPCAAEHAHCARSLGTGWQHHHRDEYTKTHHVITPTVTCSPSRHGALLHDSTTFGLCSGEYEK